MKVTCMAAAGWVLPAERVVSEGFFSLWGGLVVGHVMAADSTVGARVWLVGWPSASLEGFVWGACGHGSFCVPSVGPRGPVCPRTVSSVREQRNQCLWRGMKGSGLGCVTALLSCACWGRCCEAKGQVLSESNLVKGLVFNAFLLLSPWI